MRAGKSEMRDARREMREGDWDKMTNDKGTQRPADVGSAFIDEKYYNNSSN
jgi:hypothetical protein